MKNENAQEYEETIEPKVIKTIYPDSPEHLEEIFSYIHWIEFGHYTLFDDFEIYDTVTGESIDMKSAEKALNYEIDGIKVLDHIKNFACQLTE